MACEADIAQEPVPNNDPVNDPVNEEAVIRVEIIEPVTLREPVICAEPV
jgi:hypothetical protein